MGVLVAKCLVGMLKLRNWITHPGFLPFLLFLWDFELKRLHFRLQDGRNGNVTIHAEDQSCAILLWEQQWVRWSGRQEIRWLCPPHRSLSPRQPSDAAAPLLSICCLPSRNLPLNSQLKTCIHIQSDCTIKFMVTVRLFFFFSFHLPWKMSHASCYACWSPTLRPVSYLDELSRPGSWGSGNGHRCSRYRRWQIGNIGNMQVERALQQFAQVSSGVSLTSETSALRMNKWWAAEMCELIHLALKKRRLGLVH